MLSTKRCVRNLTTLKPFSAVEKASEPSSTYRRSQDVVSQCVQLSRVSSSPELWTKALESVIPAVALLKGEDMASILRSTARVGVRNETLLAAMCESMKTLPLLRVLRMKDIASICSSFARLNFAPSVEVLNELASEVLRSVDLYRTRNQDLCLLFRYFSILERNPDLVIRYNSEFRFPHITEKLERTITDRIGFFGPVELCVIAKYADRISLESLVRNFSRAQHVRPAVKAAFIQQLDRRFGKDAWREYEHLFVPETDSTGWGRHLEEPQGDIFTQHFITEERNKKHGFPLFQLDDELVAQALESVKQPRKPVSRSKEPKPPSKGDSPLSDDQLEFLRMIEAELGQPEVEKHKAPQTFTERVDRKLVRSIELSDIRSEKEAPELRSMRKLKKYRNRILRRFTYLAHS